MSKIATISIHEVFDYYGSVKPDVYLSDERTFHIKDHHASDFSEYGDLIASTISDPDLVLDDHKNPMTAMFIKKVDENGMNVVVRLSMVESLEDRSHPVYRDTKGKTNWFTENHDNDIVKITEVEIECLRAHVAQRDAGCDSPAG